MCFTGENKNPAGQLVFKAITSSCKQGGGLSKIQEVWWSLDSNFCKQCHYENAFLLTAEDMPEMMSEMARFRSEVCPWNKTECKKSFFRSGARKGISYFPEQLLLETTNPKFQETTNKDLVLGQKDGLRWGRERGQNLLTNSYHCHVLCNMTC